MLISGQAKSFTLGSVYFAMKDGRLGMIAPEVIADLEVRGDAIFVPLSQGTYILAGGLVEALLAMEVIQGRIVMLSIYGAWSLCQENPTLFTEEIRLVDWIKLMEEIP